MRRKQKKIAIYALLFFGIIIGMAIWNREPARTTTLAGMDAVVYRTATCGCCANFAKYLKKLGIKVEEKIVKDIGETKKEFNIPKSLSSCHTTKIGGYIVEGHIPIEGFEKLFAEKPDVIGIALPDMPSGSPGMPGKKEPFYIRSFTSSTVSDYLTL